MKKAWKRKFVFLGISALIFAREAWAQILLNPLTTDSFTALITAITNFIAGFVGGLAVLVFVFAAALFLTSRGDPSQVQKAQKAVWYAVIGLAIALAAGWLVALINYIITGK